MLDLVVVRLGHLQPRAHLPPRDVRLADGDAGGRRRPDVLEEDGDAPPPPREASPARLPHGSKLRRGKRRRLPAVRSPGYYVKLPAASAGV